METKRNNSNHDNKSEKISSHLLSEPSAGGALEGELGEGVALVELLTVSVADGSILISVRRIWWKIK